MILFSSTSQKLLLARIHGCSIDHTAVIFINIFHKIMRKWPLMLQWKLLEIKAQRVQGNWIHTHSDNVYCFCKILVFIKIFLRRKYFHCNKIWNFPLWVSSINVDKSTGNCGNPSWKTLFFVQCFLPPSSHLFVADFDMNFYELFFFKFISTKINKELFKCFLKYYNLSPNQRL